MDLSLREVQERQLIAPSRLAEDRQLYSVPGILRVDEASAINHALSVFIETGNNLLVSIVDLLCVFFIFRFGRFVLSTP